MCGFQSLPGILGEELFENLWYAVASVSHAAYISNRLFFFLNICSIVSTLQRTTVSVTTQQLFVLLQLRHFSTQAQRERLFQRISSSIKKCPCTKGLNIYTILGKLLGRGLITHCTPVISLTIHNLHREKISLLALEGSTADIILGLPWLQTHSPSIS